MKRFRLALLASILLCSSSLYAQTSSVQPEVSNLLAVLNNVVETKTAKAGDEISLRPISDLAVAGQIVIPRGAQLNGKLAEVVLKDKENPETLLVFSVEKAVLKNGTEIPLQAIVAALAAPRKESLATDPTFGMMHSNEPKMVGGATNASSAGALSPTSKATANAVVATANLTGRLDQATILDANSQGAVDIEGLKITWRLLAPPPLTVVSSKSKNLKLEAGTQMLLRMAPPRVPR